jgi:hypothetical protein
MPETDSARLKKLFLISFISLFMELLFIRWIPDSIHMLSFFSNFVLLAIFLGLGIGLALPKRKEDENSILTRIMINISVTSIIIVIFDSISFAVRPSNDLNLNEDFLRYKLHLNIYLIVSLFLCLLIYTFIPIGQMISLFFRGEKPLVNYSVNIGGSLAGIVAFSVLSYLCTPLWLWMIIALLLFISFSKSKLRFLLLSFLLVTIIMSSTYIREKRFNYRKIWSPYYCMRFQNRKDEPFVAIGNSFVQNGFNFDVNASSYRSKLIRDYLEFPFLFKKSPENVLVLGAGMGNDVECALRMGAHHVDAVEIDPMIVELGKKYNPHKPYSDKRVTIIIDDARSFTRNAKKSYDVIVYGTLDSHGLFSQMSSLKMENYVYTLESFRDTKKLLKADGVMYVCIGPYAQFVRFRLYNCIAEAFGKDPLYYLSRLGNIMYLDGAIEKIPEEIKGLTYERYVVEKELIREYFPTSFIIPTDDWPHLFLMEKRIPKEYLFSLTILFVISSVFIFTYFARSRKIDLNYFFLGAGFMLLETKSITEMGLVFGSTWLINSLVISSILLIILIVNTLLIKNEKFDSLYRIYALLGVILVLSYFFPIGKLNIPNFFIKLLLASLYISLPIACASCIFSLHFRKAGEKSTEFLASNMLGAVFGGIIEYASMIYGLKSLYLFVIALYFISMLAYMKEKPSRVGLLDFLFKEI